MHLYYLTFQFLYGLKNVVISQKFKLMIMSYVIFSLCLIKFRSGLVRKNLNVSINYYFSQIETSLKRIKSRTDQ